MKKLCFILFATLIYSSAFSQLDAIERYFEKYQDDDRFTTVYVSPKLFSMVSKVAQSEVKDEVLEVIKDLRGLRILTTEENPNAFYKEAIKTINTKEYEILMTVKDKEQNIRFMVKEGANDIINELLLLVGGEDDFVLMSFVGNIDLNKIAKLAETLDIDGAEHLGKLAKEDN
jgi:hypothetical protein